MEENKRLEILQLEVHFFESEGLPLEVPQSDMIVIHIQHRAPQALIYEQTHFLKAVNK